MQIPLLQASYLLFRPFSKPETKRWFVGVDEIASMVFSIAKSVPGSFSVSFHSHRFYKFKYSLGFPSFMNQHLVSVIAMVAGPIILGWAAPRAKGIIYVGSKGFLFGARDGRKREFEWLRKRGVAVVCYFTGSEIRSLKLTMEFENRTGVATIAGRVLEARPDLNIDAYEKPRKVLATAADDHANLIFNAKLDQISYIKRETLPFRYFYPDEDFKFLTDKFSNSSPWRVLHAPSEPLQKGTRYVREAVRCLQSEGYEFEYIELNGAPHSMVIEQLVTSQVVLNEFFAFLPGVFGIEALAHTCALLTSADQTMESDLPEGSNAAWIPTRHHQIADHLRLALDDPLETLEKAIRGYEWAQRHASMSAAGSELRRLLRGVAGS